MASVVAGLLGGCAGSEPDVTAGDQAIVELDHVIEASTDVTQPGAPRNWHLFTQVIVEDDLAPEELAQVADATITIAQDEWPEQVPGGMSFYFVGEQRGADIQAAVPLMGTVDGEPVRMSGNEIVFTSEELAAYESPAASGASS
ncbi:hypothetical protein [Demequina sp. NBRC 110057]|uniref:hypothetical protein n=1 Tax=Demequina sp. NBRC 110057 TaxID=1570346 RepID=UPI00117797EF|nr:hypothetical protein [Demequina sp. NBRC 110057]